MTNILLATSNGTGMGHLTRQAAVALSLDEEHAGVLFSLSVGLPLTERLGLRGEYCPSYEQPWIASGDWHAYLADRVVALVEETASQAVVFDGVAPYPGLARASRRLPEVAFVWLRRGMWKDSNQAALRRGEFFDLVIEPGDLAREADVGPTSDLGDAVEVAPISILEPIRPMDRSAARQSLGLPADGPVALVTLGSGRLGDVAGPGTVALETLLEEDPSWHIAVTSSPVALNEIPVDAARRVTRISDVYPLASYLSAFDLAISSAGYNAVHELIPAGVPTLLVANTATKTDDQMRRARYLEEAGLAVSVTDSDIHNLAHKSKALLDDDLRRELAAQSRTTSQRVTGASEVGEVVVDFISSFERPHRSLRQAIREGEQRAVERLKETAKQALGDERTERVKALLGRTSRPVHSRTRVELTDEIRTQRNEEPYYLALVRSVTTEDLRSNQPVEHMIPSASRGYEASRRAIVHRFYDVVDES